MLHVIDYVALGRKIRAARTRLGLTQFEVAELAYLSPSFYSHIERGTRVASLETIVNIANAFKVSLDVLLSDSLAVSIVMPSGTEPIRTAVQAIIDWCERVTPCAMGESCNRLRS